MEVNNFKNKYIEVFFGVKDFLKYKKNTYLRFRINYSWESVFDKRGETRFNELLKDYTQRPDVSCYGMFVLGWGDTFSGKVPELLDKYKAKVIVTKSQNIAGIIFPDAKHKELFLIKYIEYFPDSSLIK